ncbi:MAG TPA: TetR/AcrR family transcriptional regulator [Myxococcales bacterium]|nr:TetR family transcriptional regulator [Deltaproteobacteria bacterium]MBU49205.1 TetR family transcriptional regulator [Deltaproteobacteria bacterium]HAA55534.1 TetR/AcrR family transcriptional regulator [Myxococcales bacterium]|tara:strand:+ start:13180 stop:13731 length:552 start_codon:yes stop_codon:yes gene_type:complete
MPKIVDHDEKRREILRGSFELFAAKGYASISMRYLAEGLNVSTGTLYHYFKGGKESLFAQMFEVMTQEDVIRVSAQFKENESIEEKLQKLFIFLGKHESYFRHLLLMALDYHRHTKNKEGTLHLALASYRKALEEHLQIGEGVGAPLLSLLIGMVAQQWMDPENASPETHLALLQSLLSQYTS